MIEYVWVRASRSSFHRWAVEDGHYVGIPACGYEKHAPNGRKRQYRRQPMKACSYCVDPTLRSRNIRAARRRMVTASAPVLPAPS